MTAEVGILTKTGVALAADSAVTVTNSNTKKVYNSVNKLFSLSKKHPVGIMVYGNGSFMGVPWEIVIKEYRIYLGNIYFDKLDEYADNFLLFLITDSRFYNEDYERNLIYKSITNLLPKIKERLNTQCLEFEKIQKRKINDIEIEQELSNIINNQLRFLNEKTKSNFYNPNHSININNLWYGIRDRFGREIVEKFERGINFNIVSTSLIELIFKYVAALISLNSQMGTAGIVITGYGNEDIFPSLVERKIEGIVFDYLKYNDGDVTKIDASRCTASIKPFAQQEMIWSFVSGIEPGLNDAYLKIFKDVITTYMNGKNITTIDTDVSQVIDSIKANINRYKQEKYINPLLDVVRSLPKEDLVMMAETLVNLTSFKRKVSMDMETVGGPIDVAFISKGDGFIWINRKHYFKPEYNYAFFQNYLRGDENDDFKGK